MAMILDNTALESVYEYTTAQVQNFSFPVVYEVWSIGGIGKSQNYFGSVHT